MSVGTSKRVALIVGGTSGIGLATAKAFVALGDQVVVAGRNPERGEAAQRSLGKSSAFVGCDVRDSVSVAALMKTVVERFGHPDCAVNCAASDWLPSLTHETKCESAGELIATDVLGLFNCMKFEIETMLQFSGGTIVNVSSVNGMAGTPLAAIYSAGKHAVIGLTRSAAKEYIGRGIRINAVCPGATDTPRRERRTAHLDQDQLQEQQVQLAQAIPIGRPAHPEEIADAILWLSTSASSYVVGHSLVIDGGLSA